MRKTGKKFLAAKAKVEARPYGLADAMKLVRAVKFAKFDESVDVAMLLGVDPKHADQMVRGTVVLPHGIGKSKRVAVIAGGDKAKEAQESGADHVGAEELVEKIQGGFLDFDALVATPDMMRLVGKLGKVLGPKGLMPNPKAGTVTMDVGKAVREIKAGKVEFRVDKTSIIHASIGKTSFDETKLEENASAFIRAVLRARPPAAKGKFFRTVSISSTMGPGIDIDTAAVEAL
ncbi:MAG TPA: 50S ribosomal protein L1 [Thermoanaerobaculia bacterium]|jgi:large subunit ribosomal protein L1|nr:50S ribosomal protein L1 [Thermoanaerobaculia bacterium]HXM79741.1 50S ribosomal protein L1 [Thermoanaerobaculia bacterium]